MFRRNKFFMLMNAQDDNGSGGGGSGEGDKNKGGGSDGGTGGSADDGKNGGTGGKLDLTTLPKEVQDLIGDLRKENAKYRTEGKKTSDRLSQIEAALKKVTGDGEDEETPEQKLSKLSNLHEAAEVRSSMLEIALGNGITKDQFEYFEFLMSKKLSALEEDGELEESDLEEIIGKVKAGQKREAGNTSVDDDKSKQKNPGGSSEEVTLDQFTKMGMIQKSKLYNEKPELYNKLVAEAKSKKLI